MARYEIRFAKDAPTWHQGRSGKREPIREDRFELWRDGQYAGVGIEVRSDASPRDRWLAARMLVHRARSRLGDEAPEFVAGDDTPETKHFMEVMADA